MTIEDMSETGFEPLNHPGHLVRRLHQICVSIFLDSAAQYDLTHIQYAALHGIDHFPGIDQATLAKLIAIDRQTMSNVVTRLSQKGLIQKKMKDKRTNALYISGAGRALIDIMEQFADEIDERILAPLDRAERRTFMALLEKLVRENNERSRAPQSVVKS